MKRLAWCLILAFITILVLPACGNDDGAHYYSYKGVTYKGQGTLETMVNVAIQNQEELLYVGTVKIIDDKPTIWKALEAINQQDDLALKIEKNEQGQIQKVNKEENNQESSWLLLVNNVPLEGEQNLEDIEVFDEGVTLIYQANEKSLQKP
ncbi:MAG: hypothetical protein K6T85_19615 [Gorillibacterium sp.]|nr:hypothetical protein [Gorillibacterium sp.]